MALPLIGSRWRGGKSKRPPYGYVLWEVVEYRERGQWSGNGLGIAMKRLDNQAKTQPPGTIQVVALQCFEGNQPSLSYRATYQPWTD